MLVPRMKLIVMCAINLASSIIRVHLFQLANPKSIFTRGVQTAAQSPLGRVGQVFAPTRVAQMRFGSGVAQFCVRHAQPTSSTWGGFGRPRTERNATPRLPPTRVPRLSVRCDFNRRWSKPSSKARAAWRRLVFTAGGRQ